MKSRITERFLEQNRSALGEGSATVIYFNDDADQTALALKALLNPKYVGIAGGGAIKGAPEQLHWDPWLDVRIVIISPLTREEILERVFGGAHPLWQQEECALSVVDLGKYGSYSRNLDFAAVPLALRDAHSSIAECAAEAIRHPFDLVIADLLHQQENVAEWGLSILERLQQSAPDVRRLVLTSATEERIFHQPELWQAGDLIHRWQPNIPQQVRRANLAIHWSLSMAHHLSEAKARNETIWLEVQEEKPHIQIAVLSDDPGWPQSQISQLCWLHGVPNVNVEDLGALPEREGIQPCYVIALCDNLSLACWRALPDYVRRIAKRLGAPPLVVVCPSTESERPPPGGAIKPRALIKVTLDGPLPTALIADCLVQPRLGPLATTDREELSLWLSATWLPFLEEARAALLRRRTGLTIPRRKARRKIPEPAAEWLSCEPLSLGYASPNSFRGLEALLVRHQRGDMQASQEILKSYLSTVGLEPRHQEVMDRIIRSLPEIDGLASVLKGRHREHFHHIVKVSCLGYFLLTVPACCRDPNEPLVKRIPALAQDRTRDPADTPPGSERWDGATESDVLRAWWLAAIAHDHAYPLAAVMKPLVQMAEIPRELFGIYESMRRLPLAGTPLFRTLDPKRFSTAGHLVENSLAKFRQIVAEVLKVIWKDSIIDPSTVPDEFLYDHGILSAVNLALLLADSGYSVRSRRPEQAARRVKQLLEHHRPWMAMALRAIARHNLEAHSQGGEIALVNHPIDFMLLLCDELQEWQRLVLQGGAIVSPASHVEIQLNRLGQSFFFDRRLNFRINFPEEERLKRLGWEPDSAVELKRLRLKALASSPGVWPKEILLEASSRHSMRRGSG
jgi:hypothetical protein